MRWNVINELIKAHDLGSYLEIGVQNRVNFDKILCKVRHGVDPESPAQDVMGVTSDDFFSKFRAKDYDIVFIDGLHHADQVERDIVNASQFAKWIVLHDCNPPSEESQRVPRETKVWTGDVWRAFVGFRQKYPEFETYCHEFDFGVGVIKVERPVEPGFLTDMRYADFHRNKKELLCFT